MKKGETSKQSNETEDHTKKLKFGPVPVKRKTNMTAVPENVEDLHIPLINDKEKQYFRNELPDITVHEKKYIQPAYDPSYKCPCGFTLDPRDGFEIGWRDGDKVFINQFFSCLRQQTRLFCFIL